MPRWATIALLTALSFAARFPALASPDTTNSDAAIVGLQGMHVLRGELSPLLWGSTYQTSVDAIVAAGFFAVLGATSFALMLSALSLHAALTVLVFLLLEAALGRARAFVLALLLVFTGAAVHSYALYPPRQAALTLGVAALFALDRACRADASSARGPMLAFGGALTTFSLYADPYALLLVPGAGVLAFFAIMARGVAHSASDSALWRERGARALAVGLGAALGAVPLLLLARHPSWKSGEAALTLGVFAKNTRLLWSPCGPWAFGTAVYHPVTALNYVPWVAPSAVRVVQAVGGTLLVLGAFVAPVAVFSSRVSSHARRLGLAGAAVAWGTLAGFLLSVMVMDHFSMRYLAAAIIAAPLSLAPLASASARVVSLRAAATWVAPMIASGWIGGWASMGTGPGREDERALLGDLEREGVRAAVADYWVSYRLTFLTQERLVVVPTHPAQDRYPAYRAALVAAPRMAYIVDRFRSDESAGDVEARLRAESGRRLVTTLTRGTMTAFIMASRSD